MGLWRSMVKLNARMRSSICSPLDRLAVRSSAGEKERKKAAQSPTKLELGTPQLLLFPGEGESRSVCSWGKEFGHRGSQTTSTKGTFSGRGGGEGRVLDLGFLEKGLVHSGSWEEH